jgi:hypothetical protein
VVRSILYLQSGAAGHDAIVDLFRRRGILERAARQGGCLGAELEVPAQADGAILVTALRADVAAYERWVANPERVADAVELAALVEGDFDSDIRAETYEIVLAAGNLGRDWRRGARGRSVGR